MTIYTKADWSNHIKKTPRKKWSLLRWAMKLASSANEACFVGQRSLLRFWDKFCVNTDILWEHGWSLTRLGWLKFKRTRISRIARIALWAWWLEIKTNTNRAKRDKASPPAPLQKRWEWLDSKALRERTLIIRIKRIALWALLFEIFKTTNTTGTTDTTQEWTAEVYMNTNRANCSKLTININQD